MLKTGLLILEALQSTLLKKVLSGDISIGSCGPGLLLYPVQNVVTNSQELSSTFVGTIPLSQSLFQVQIRVSMSAVELQHISFKQQQKLEDALLGRMLLI